MKQLNPKAIWLFFLMFIGRMFPVYIIFLFMLAPYWASVSDSAMAHRYGFMGDILAWTPVVLLGLLIIAWVWARLSYKFYKYELREDGFRKESGIIWKKYTTIPYGRIQNVEIYRGLIARILGLSDLHIQTAGGVAQPRYGAFSEGRLPGLSREDAEKMRDELVRRTQQNAKSQGL